MPLQENRRKTHTRNSNWSKIFFIFQPRTTSNQVNSCFQLRSLSKPTKKKEVTIKKPTFHPTRKSVSPSPETKHVSTKKLTVKPVTPAQATFKAVSRAKPLKSPISSCPRQGMRSVSHEPRLCPLCLRTMKWLDP